MLSERQSTLRNTSEPLDRGPQGRRARCPAVRSRAPGLERRLQPARAAPRAAHGATPPTLTTPTAGNADLQIAQVARRLGTPVSDRHARRSAPRMARPPSALMTRTAATVIDRTSPRRPPISTGAQRYRPELSVIDRSLRPPASDIDRSSALSTYGSSPPTPDIDRRLALSTYGSTRRPRISTGARRYRPKAASAGRRYRPEAAPSIKEHQCAKVRVSQLRKFVSLEKLTPLRSITPPRKWDIFKAQKWDIFEAHQQASARIPSTT